MVAFGEYVDDGTASAMKARDYKDATDLVAQPVAVDIDNCNLTGDCSGNILAGAQMRTNKGMGVMTDMQVRRLTPTECERLQGFPDGYTNIKDDCPDGPRYKALGNSMAVPVMRWIGQHIHAIEGLTIVRAYSPCA
jgi:DNA (cytosine-5)-methyltransferase 1